MRLGLQLRASAVALPHPSRSANDRCIFSQCLQGYPQFQMIPHKLTVAKRLSQCLNPALPTGVHQRALDVYTHILTAIGVSGQA